VTLGDLVRHLEGAELHGDPATPVTEVSHDSRRAGPGTLFVAIRGHAADGHEFLEAARRKGAAAFASEEPPRPGAPWVRVRDAREALAVLSAALLGYPARELELVGVTGTNGKTTTAYMVDSALRQAGETVGLLGTVEYRVGDRVAEAVRTTPEASDLQTMLRQMKDAGCRRAVLEVSSHSLVLRRVHGLEFRVAVFTNLTRDHLDFHGDLESYFAVKRRLFTDYLKPAGRAVIGVGDDWGRRLAGELAAAGVPVVTWGEDDGDVRAASAELDLAGIRARLVTPRGELAVASPLIGRFNLLNVLAAVAVAEALELEPAAAVRGIAAEGPLPGRLEPVRAGQDFPVFVDYAHTPGALAAALGSLRELSARRIAVVFGCGGERDRGKRPEMGRIAGELADLAIVTSDNPRGEDPEAILDAVEVGLRQSGGRYRRVTDRRAALREAVEVAASGGAPGWMVLAAGKGHEQVQLVGESRIPFSDRRELEAALARSGNA